MRMNQEENPRVHINSLSHFLHYFERDFDRIGISNYSHEQAFREGLKMSAKQMKRLNALFIKGDNEELKKMLKQLKMLD